MWTKTWKCPWLPFLPCHCSYGVVSWGWWQIGGNIDCFSPILHPTGSILCSEVGIQMAVKYWTDTNISTWARQSLRIRIRQVKGYRLRNHLSGKIKGEGARNLTFSMADPSVENSTCPPIPIAYGWSYVALSGRPQDVSFRDSGQRMQVKWMQPIQGGLSCGLNANIMGFSLMIWIFILWWLICCYFT